MLYNLKYIDAKIRKAQEKLGLSSSSSKNDGRLPPGQRLTEQFPVLDLGVRPDLALENFTLLLSGEVLKPLTLTYSEFSKLPAKTIQKDFHCVTKWSKYDLIWKGVAFEDIFKIANVRDTVKFVSFKSRDGYSTNVPLSECLGTDTLFAFELNGSPIPLLHGGPVRVIVPNLYGWKSAKFVNEVEFLSIDAPGFWETRGYNNHGDPWKEERYS